MSRIEARAQSLSFGVDGTISTVAGSYNLGAGYTGDGGLATSAQLNVPVGVVFDVAGNLYIADYNNNVVRKVNKSGTITTFAGNGTQGYSGDGESATSAELYNPSGLAVDASGNLYIADDGNSVIRKVDPTGAISTVAGNHSLGAGYGGDGGPATSAQLNKPLGVSLDSTGNLYIADTANNVVRRINLSGTISTVAGSFAAGAGYSGDGGPATKAQLNFPFAVAFDSAGGIYIADAHNNVVRKVLPSGVIITFAGNGTASYDGDGGAATNAGLYYPFGLAIDATGSVYISDYNNYVVRRVDPAGIITTIAGSHIGQVWDTSYGASQPGYFGDGGPATSAGLGSPFGLTLDASGNLYLADSNNNVVRRVTVPSQNVGLFPNTAIGSQSSLRITLSNTDPSIPLQINSIALGSSTSEFALSAPSSGGCSLTTGFQLASSQSCTISATLQPSQVGLRTALLEVNSNTINTNTREPNLALEGSGLGPLARFEGGTISIFAGTLGKSGYSGDGGPATSALLNASYVAVDSLGNVFIAQVSPGVIRKVDSTGVITTVAGGTNASGPSGTAGNGGPATSAYIGQPEGIAVDAAGNLYITDPFYEYVRKVDTKGNISIFAGNGCTNGSHGCYGGDGGPATQAELDAPYGITVDAKGNVYFSETNNSDIRKVDTNGIITTVAGNHTGGYSGDGGPATSAALCGPFDVKVDQAGNLYIADSYNSVIRKVDTNGIITTVAGNNNYGGCSNLVTKDESGDGGPAISALLSFPTGVALDAADNLYITDLEVGVVRRVDTSGIISTLGGGQPEICSNAADAIGDGCPFTSASLIAPSELALDASGYIYIVDGADGANVVRRVEASTFTSFGTQPEDSSASRNVFLLNIGNLPMQLASAATFQITGINAPDFHAVPGANQGCTPGQSVQPGAYCTVTVSFLPSLLGQESGSLLINSNAVNAALTIATLSGTGTAPQPPDFSLPVTPPAISLTAGQTGTAAFAVTPVSGFTGTVSFICSVPSNMSEASCSAPPVQVTGTSSVTSTVTVSTTGLHQLAQKESHQLRLAASVLTLFGGVIWYSIPFARRRRFALVILTLTLSLAFASSCGGGGGGNGGGSGGKTDPGTPVGNYTLTVLATSGALTHTMNVAVTVQ
jgi:sugar lactone lactonase YvrE